MNTVKSSKHRDPYVWDDRGRIKRSIELSGKTHYFYPTYSERSYCLTSDFNLGHIVNVPIFIRGKLINVHWETLHENLRWTEDAFLLVSRDQNYTFRFYLLFKPRKGSWCLWEISGSAIEECQPTFANYKVGKSFVKLGQERKGASYLSYVPQFIELREYNGFQKIIFWNEVSQDVFTVEYNGITHAVTQKCPHEWVTKQQAMFLYTMTCTRCGISRSYDSSG